MTYMTVAEDLWFNVTVKLLLRIMYSGIRWKTFPCAEFNNDTHCNTTTEFKFLPSSFWVQTEAVGAI